MSNSNNDESQMSVRSAIFGFRVIHDTTKEDVEDFYQLLPTFLQPQLKVEEVVVRSPKDIMVNVLTDSAEEMGAFVSSLTAEVLQQAWDVFCQAREMEQSPVPLECTIRCFAGVKSDGTF